MKVIVDGHRLAPSVNFGVVNDGAKPTVKVTRSPRVTWNGNPFCIPGAVLYLPGYPETGATITDFSGQGNTGVLNNVTWTRLPSGLSVMVFNGTTSYIDCGRDSSLDVGTKDFSTELWLNINDKSAYRIFASKGRVGSSTGWLLRINQTTGILAFRSDDTVLFTNATSSTDVCDGTWHHIVVVADRDGLVTFYLDGVSDGSGDISGGAGSLTKTDRDFCIGIDSTDEVADPWNGSLSLIRHYFYTLSADQIYADFQKERHLFGV